MSNCYESGHIFLFTPNSTDQLVPVRRNRPGSVQERIGRQAGGHLEWFARGKRIHADRGRQTDRPGTASTLQHAPT